MPKTNASVNDAKSLTTTIFTFNTLQTSQGRWCLGVLVAASALRAWAFLVVIQATYRPGKAQQIPEDWKALRYCGSIKEAQYLSFLILLKENSLCKRENVPVDEQVHWDYCSAVILTAISLVMLVAYSTPFTTCIPFFTCVFIHKFAWQGCYVEHGSMCWMWMYGLVLEWIIF